MGEQPTRTPEALAAAYLDNFRNGTDDTLWAFDAVVESCSSLEAGVSVTVALVSATKTDVELAYVAAGPVEDMLKWHGKKALVEFSRIAKDSGAMRRALEGVWLNPSDEAYDDWCALGQSLGLKIEVPKILTSKVRTGRGKLPKRR